VLAVIEFGTLLLGIAGVLTAIGGIMSSILGIKAGHREAEKKAAEAKIEADERCFERLLSAQRTAEELSSELYKMRLRWHETEVDEE
jgi:ribulose 1,5-bisphosphate carboxylase large subunit-like protein